MSEEFSRTHLTLVAECNLMESLVGTLVGDQYFTFKISKEELDEQERVFKPVRDYQIYCCVELPKRSWPGSTYIMLPLDQFSVAGSEGSWPITKLSVDHRTPRQFWIQLVVHKRRKITGTSSWAHLQPGDKATAYLCLPMVSADGGDKVELHSISDKEPSTQADANPRQTHGLGRKRTILKNFAKEVTDALGDLFSIRGEPETGGEYARHRTHSGRRD
jgi:hypothetical protein